MVIWERTPKHKSSETRNHFSQVDTTKVKCSYFIQVISKESGATGNLSQHVLTKHQYTGYICL